LIVFIEKQYLLGKVNEKNHKMLNVSIVLYCHQPEEIEGLVRSLRDSGVVNEIFLVDNSPQRNADFEKLGATYIFNNKNLGYGAAHNIALRKTLETSVPFHLVVNPDISFEPEVLQKIESFMRKNENIGLLSPKIFYPNGKLQYVCKFVPMPYDLFCRRFLPKRMTKKHNAYFGLRFTGYNKIMEVPYLSGSFMILRTKALCEVGLFDERFFMYPEDIDLSRRIHQKFQTVFYPEVSITHTHTRGSYVNTRLMWIHIFNLIKYFNKWGWFFDKERREINKKVLNKLQTNNEQNFIL
jgi:GT2 family glycosyltransferase